MDRDQLRALQAPLKQRYREDPASALVTLRAELPRRGKLSDKFLSVISGCSCNQFHGFPPKFGCLLETMRCRLKWAWPTLR